jgi:uncharacterized protein (TIGR03437 family)
MPRFALVTIFSLLNLSVQQLSAQTPQIKPGGVVNAATYSASAPLAPGVLFSVFGVGAVLTDGSTAGAGITPLPTRLAGARLLVNGVAAPLFYASPGQINAQFPVELAGVTSATVQVEVQSARGTVTSPAVTVPVAPFSPGIFTQDQNGSGPGSIFRASDFSKICPPGRFDCGANPAMPGEAVSIFMTGLGAVNGLWASGQAASSALSTTTTPVVTIGGVQAQVSFSGLATRFVGLYQVNVIVPDISLKGTDIPLTLSIGGQASNTVTIAIGPTGPFVGGGPPGGTVNALVLDPLNHNTMYAGTNGGVFKSTNGGQSWTGVNSGLPDLGVRVLAIDPIHSGTVYALTNSGIFKSADGGASWTATSVPTATDPSGRTFYPGIITLAIDPLNPSTLYAGTGAGVFKSANGGASWTAINDGLPRIGPPPANPSLPTFPAPIGTLAVDPLNSATLYAGTANNSPQSACCIFKSTNGGVNWTAAGNGLTSTTPSGLAFTPSVQVLAIAPSSASTLYAGTAAGGVFKSTDGGASWTAVNNGLTSTLNGQTFYAEVTALAVDPQNPSIVYAGIYGGVTRTTNGGANWSPASNGIFSTYVPALAIDPSSPATVFAATDGGVFKSADQGASWNAANNGITTPKLISALAIDPVSPSTLFAGISPLVPGNPGVFKTTNGGASWTAANSGLKGHANALVIDPSNSAIVYAGIGGVGLGDGMYKSTDGGTTWSAINNGMAPFPRGVHALAIAPSNSAVLYMATGGGGNDFKPVVYKSSDGGASWNAASSGLPISTIVSALIVDPSNSATLYAGTVNGVFKSGDGGTSWTAANNGLPVFASTYLSALAIDPSHPTILYASVGLAAAVFKSTDGGGNWTAANSGLPAAIVQTLAIDPANPATLYAATGVGVFKTTNGGLSWSAANSGLRNGVSVLAITPGSSPTTIYAGTSGAGVFKSTDGGASWQPTGANQD